MAAKHSEVEDSYEVLQRLSQRPGAYGEKEGFLDSLHLLIHSTHATDRAKAVELLKGLGEPDRTKELIQFFDDCMWRESKLAVVGALASSSSPRGLEFLIGVASDDLDLGLAKAAVEALARTGRPQAMHYLTGRFESGDDPLLPYIVYALGGFHADLLRDKLLPTLARVAEPECSQPLLAQSLIFTLAEQRVHKAVPLLLRLCRQNALQRKLRLSALLALQQLALDPRELAPLAGEFTETFFEQHLLASTLRDAELRRAITLEDIVSKLAEAGYAEAAYAEPSVAAALDRFPPHDVSVGLDLFWQACQNPQKFSHILRHCNHEFAHERYVALLDPQAPVTTLIAVLKDVEYHVDVAFKPAFDRLLPQARADPSAALFDALCAAVVSALPNGSDWVLDELEATGHRLGFKHWLCAVNRVTHRLLALPRGSGSFLESCARIAKLLETNQDKETHGRILRACGQLRYTGRSVWRHAERALRDPDLQASARVYLEQCPNQRAARLLTPLVDDLASFENAPWGYQVLLFRAIRAQRRLPDHWPALDELLSRAIGGEWGTGALVRALSVLGQHPRPGLAAAVLELGRRDCLEHQVWLWVIVALKALAPPQAASVLSPCLVRGRAGVSESVCGRTLDALCALDDDGARSQVVAFLVEHVHDIEICEKVIRCLTPPRGQRRQLADQLGQLLSDHPQHPLYDALAMLRDRMLYYYVPQERRGSSSLELLEVDARLEASVPSYASLPDAVKASIRGAELPYLHKELYSGYVDKSVCVMGYCKAIDLILLERLGNRRLFPRLRQRLSAFQNVLFALGIQGDTLEVSELHAKLHLGTGVSVEDVPIKKMRRICRSVCQGTILRDSWVIDGLSAWAVVLLLFVRGEGTLRRNFFPILLPRAADQDIIELANNLLRLQEGRNQAAHRETFVEFLDVSRLRAQALKIVRGLDAMLAEATP